MNTEKQIPVYIRGFGRDVYKGLTSNQKSIPSKYLYDRKGSMLFEEIMDLPEYYPSRSELEILRNKKAELAKRFQNEAELYIADLGAGNGLKTFVLLKYLFSRMKVSFFPIDISESALNNLYRQVQNELPELHCETIHKDYIQGLNYLRKKSDTRKLILFLGSSIGNFSLYEAIHFLKSLRDSVNEGDYVLTGFDLKKNPEMIRKAYFDSRGVTAKFNLNLLKRMNRELGAEFKEENFLYYPSYDPTNGELKSYLISTIEQDVFIRDLNLNIHFKKWESIQTECSNKYDIETIRNLAFKTDFEIEENFFDEKEMFCCSLWKAI